MTNPEKIINALKKLAETDNIPYTVAITLAVALVMSLATNRATNQILPLIIAIASFTVLGAGINFFSGRIGKNQDAQIVSLQKGYRHIRNQANELIKTSSEPLKVYIHNFSSMVNGTSPERKYVEELLSLVAKNIANIGESEAGQSTEISKVYVFCINQNSNNDKFIELENQFLGILADKYLEYLGVKDSQEKQRRRDEALRKIKPHVRVFFEDTIDNAETVILVGNNNAKLFCKLPKGKGALLLNLEGHFMSQALLQGVDRFLDEAYFKFNQGLVGNRAAEIIRDRYFAGSLYDERVLQYFTENGQRYDILSLHGYCLFGYQFDYQGKATTIANILLERSRHGADIRVNAHVIDQNSEKLKNWIFVNDYSPARYKEHQHGTDQFFQAHGNKNFTLTQYRYLPECLLIIIDKHIMLISFYNEYGNGDPTALKGYHFDFAENKFRFPVFKLDADDQNDKTLFDRLKRYYDNMTFTA